MSGLLTLILFIAVFLVFFQTCLLPGRNRKWVGWDIAIRHFFVIALNRSYLSKCVGQIYNTLDKVGKKNEHKLSFG